MTPIDIPAIAARLATKHTPTPAGATIRTGGPTLAQQIERLIDDAALAGAFTDLADRTSIEVTELTGADRTVWICFEFDHDRHLLRAGPVPVGELAADGLSPAEDITMLLGRVRRLMSTAVLLNSSTARSGLLSARARTSRSGPQRLSILGHALDEEVLEAVRNTCLDSYDNPTGDSMRLGAALAAVRDNPLSKAQAYGSDPIPDRIEALMQQAEEAEMDIAAQHLPVSLDMSVYTAGDLVCALIDAIANPMADPSADVEGPVMVACRKRREACAELIASSSHAQHFVFERANEMAHTDVVLTTETALLLSSLAEGAERRSEPFAARSADTEAARHEHKAERTVANAWFAATEALSYTEPVGSRGKVIADWERGTGGIFAGARDQEP
ncbi:hypothetical protein [Catenulispora pinisilvae]|uniref:hypothetical protein n=1 Tax=Catenulispora pinisilvae TaxID=2705253 RepID=UPI00189272E3|nr:hypothetical protein [Catenulispora pinisilvae]